MHDLKILTLSWPSSSKACVQHFNSTGSGVESGEGDLTPRLQEVPERITTASSPNKRLGKKAFIFNAFKMEKGSVLFYCL
jgi:hypothetical protein